MSVCEILGWVGVAFLVIAYGLLSTKKLQAGVVYQILNIIGSVGLLVAGFEKSNYPTVGLQIIWILIGSVGIVMIVRGKKTST